MLQTAEEQGDVMSLEAHLTQAAPASRASASFESCLKNLGSLLSIGLLGLTALEYVGLVHTTVSWFVVDQLVNGESRFNANGDIHGDWGNLAFAVLAAPVFIGMYGAAGISFIREYFTGTAA